jgi:hypothetical protein
MKNRTTIFTAILLALGFLALQPVARAVIPAPDGGYPGQNTAEGQSALLHLTGGTYNTALGWASLGFNVTGNNNTGVGAGTLLRNTADNNTAAGAGALLSNTTGDGNTANGAFALLNNTTGESNTAAGAAALLSNISGSFNTAIGHEALDANITGNGNTAIGAAALTSSTGNFNTAIGDLALAGTTGNGNIGLGSNGGAFLTTGSGNIDIGHGGVGGESHTIRIGVPGSQTNCYIAGIFGATVFNGAAVFVGPDGKLGTVTSSARFKEEIRSMDQASEALLALKPVAFRYTKNIDPAGVSQFGLLAEDVEKVNPALIVRDKEGKPYSVRYDQVNALLLNEFLKEHKRVEEQQAAIRRLKSKAATQEATIAELKKGMGVLTAQVEEQAAQIQKVSAHLEMSRPAPRVVANP